MKSNKKRILFVLAILTMALVLSCALVACTKADTPDAPKKEFTITFDTQGGSEVKPITIAEGAKITLPRNPTKEGYIFDGWYLSNALVEEFNITKTITGNITLYAKWIEDSGIRRPSEGLEYSLNSDGNGYTVTGIGTCTDKELIIPSEYNAKPVTGIGNSAFSGCTWLTSVIIPDSVTSIGGSAFEDCTGLTSITIPDSVTSIGSSAFYGCTGLAKITGSSTVASTVAKQCGSKSFEVVITSGESIGSYAFYGCSGLTSVTIGNSVTSVGYEAFSRCTGLTSITIPDSVTIIDSSAFYNCTGLTSVTIGNSVTSIGDDAFYGCKGLTSVTIPDSVTSIAEGAFSGCSSIESIIIPFVGAKAGVTSSDTYQYPFGYIFGTSSYAGGVATEQYYYGSSTSSTTYKTYYIPSSLKSVTVTGGNILYGVFSYCTGLTSVTIGNGVTSIGKDAFYGCTGLTSITVAKGNTKYHSAGNCLIETESKTLIAGCKNSIIPTDGSVTSIGSSAFRGCTGLTSVVIPGSVTSIGSSAFRGCTGLTSVVIPHSVTSIGDYAFYGCKELTSITIPDSVTSIGYEAFSGCSSLESITIPFVGAKAGVTSSDTYQYPFGYIFGTSRYTGGVATEQYYYGYSTSSTISTTYYIPSSLKSVTVTGGNILYGAFRGCTGLTSITIPDSVTSIGEDAFYNTAWYNNQPDGLVYAGKVAYKYKGTMPSNTSIVLKEGTLGINAYAFVGCKGLTSVTIPDSVTSIGQYSFYGCTGLTSVTIGNSVTGIGYAAFGGCSSLESITIPFVGAKAGVTSSDTYQYPFGDIFGTSRYDGGVATKQYYYGSSTSSLTSYTYYIPSSLKAVTVTGGNILAGAFSGCTGLTSVTIGNSVTSIGGSAFSGCTGLTSITIPNSVTSIGGSAFSGCTGLTNITIPDSVTSIGGDAFYNTAWYNNQPYGLVYAGKVAYKYKGTMPSNTSIVLKKGTLGIAGSAFEDCTGLTSVTIPDSVTSIGDWAFAGCSGLTSITVAKGNTKYHSAGNCLIETESKTLIAGCKNSIIPTDGSVTSIGSSAFRGCTGLTSITIPDSVTSIGDSAFSGCSGLTSVVIPGSVTSIGSSAFERCTGLTSVTIPNGVKAIPSYAFYGCTGLTSITIPDSVTSIGYSAFSWCTGLTSVTIGNSVTSIGDLAFSYCTRLTSVTIPDSVTSIYFEAFFECTRLTSVTIGSGVTSIGGSAFESCNNLQDIYITDIAAWFNISGLDNLMRYGASNKNLYINNELATSIAIPDSVTSIDERAFSNCTGLTSITIPNSVTSIGDWAFAGCTGLTSVTIPNSVTSIGDWAFAGCSGLTSITVAKGNTKYHSAGNCLIETESKTLIAGCKNSIIPTDGSVTSIGSSAFRGCTGLTSITIPDSVTSIGDSAFSGCSGLTSMTIPDSVTSIGGWAFYNCTGLTSIKFNGTKAQWNAISKGSYWKYNVPATQVGCTDGTVSI